MSGDSPCGSSRASVAGSSCSEPCFAPAGWSANHAVHDHDNDDDLVLFDEGRSYAAVSGTKRALREKVKKMRMDMKR